MRQSSAYDEEGGEFSPPSGINERLTCDLLIAGGGLSGLSAAEAALRRGLDVIVIEKGAFGKDAASGLNAGQFLTGWAKPVDIMLAELAQQELRGGLPFDQAQLHAQRRVRAFLRRTVEGCQRLAELDHHYNLRASVQHGAVMAAVTEVDMVGLRAAYQFMDDSNLRALMPMTDKRRARFFETLSAAQVQRRYGTAEGFYVGGVVDRFGGSFRPRKFLIGLARALQKRGVRFFQGTEAQAFDFSDGQVSVFCGNGANIRANTLFMANAYARHINGDVLERAIFEYDYVVAIELPDGAKTLSSGTVLSDTREPCFSRAAMAGGSIWATRKHREPRPTSRATSPAERWPRASGCFRDSLPSASAISGAHGAGGCSTPWTTIPSSNAGMADASSPSRRRPITAIRWRCASDNSWATPLPLQRCGRGATMTSGSAATMLGSCGCSKASRKGCACGRASGIRKLHSARLNQPLWSICRRFASRTCRDARARGAVAPRAPFDQPAESLRLFGMTIRS